jgi:hypothetical protein
MLCDTSKVPRIEEDNVLSLHIRDTCLFKVEEYHRFDYTMVYIKCTRKCIRKCMLLQSSLLPRMKAKEFNFANMAFSTHNL